MLKIKWIQIKRFFSIKSNFIKMFIADITSIIVKTLFAILFYSSFLCFVSIVQTSSLLHYIAVHFSFALCLNSHRYVYVMEKYKMKSLEFYQVSLIKWNWFVFKYLFEKNKIRCCLCLGTSYHDAYCCCNIIPIAHLCLSIDTRRLSFEYM